MPELIGFSTCTDFEPLYNMICYAIVVSAPKLAFYLNPAHCAVREREICWEYKVIILKWYDFHKAWIWSRFFKALKCGTGRWRRNLLEFLVSQKENNVPRSHTHKRGHKSLIKRQKAFISNSGQPTFPRRFVNCLLSIFRIDFFHFSIRYYNPLVHEPGSNHINGTWGQTGTETGTKTGQKVIPGWITW